MKRPLVAVSIGHSFKDPGAPAPGPDEFERAAQVVNYMELIWPQMTTTIDLYVPHEADLLPAGKGLKETIRLINAHEATIAAELHFNSASYPERRGGEVFYYKKGKELAETLQVQLMLWHPGVHCHVKPDTKSYVKKLGFLRKTKMPAVLIEPCFLSNELDRFWLEEHWKELAVRLIEGLTNYLALTF